MQRATLGDNKKHDLKHKDMILLFMVRRMQTCLYHQAGEQL
jgi:hypothetical protein